jgi:hypothetical protein
VSDIDVEVVDGLKALDPERPIREGDKARHYQDDDCGYRIGQPSEQVFDGGQGVADRIHADLFAFIPLWRTWQLSNSARWTGARRGGKTPASSPHVNVQRR